MLAHVVVGEQRLGCCSHTGIDDEHFVDERNCLATDMLRELKLSSGNLLIKILVAGTSKRELAAKHGVKKNACSPYVSRWSNILSL